MIKRVKQMLHTIGRTFMPHLYDLNPKLKPTPAPAPVAAKKAPAKKAKGKKK
tara:strand:+ start:1027 stop:1182 length:156 start_codon:yes stop_codon:yes gene_type:complete